MFPSDELTAARSQRSALAVLVAKLDPDSVALAEAEPLWEAFDGIARLAASARTLLARRVADSASWKRSGERSAAEHLARKAGTSTGTARSELDTSERLRGLPGTESALRRGELSGPQAAAVADAASADPGAEQRLLEKAQTSNLAELRDDCARAKAAADPDPEATWRRLHAERRLRRFVDGEGAWNLSARGTVDAGSRFNAALDPIIDELFSAARRQGRREPREAYAFDALVELALRGTAVPTPGTASAPVGAAATAVAARAMGTAPSQVAMTPGPTRAPAATVGPKRPAAPAWSPGAPVAPAPRTWPFCAWTSRRCCGAAWRATSCARSPGSGPSPCASPASSSATPC